MEFYQLTPKILAVLETSQLPSFVKERVDALYDEIKQCTLMAEYSLTAILGSETLNEALITIDMQDEEFINKIIWSIKESVDLNRLSKLEFVRIFADKAVRVLIQKRIEIDHIYAMYLEQYLDKA